MSIDRTALERSLHRHGPDSWDEHDIGIMADAADDLDPDNLDAESLAHGIWSMGASDPEPHGCRYAEGDNDADYVNACEHCQAWLVKLATALLADLDSWPCATCGSGEHNTSQHGSGFSAEQFEWANLVPESNDSGTSAIIEP